MTATHPGKAPELLYDGVSECNGALIAAGLPLTPPKTGVFYTVSERVYAQNSAVQEWRYDDWRERRTTATANVAQRREGRVTA